MSGHSKWANIRVRKGAQDAKRGKVYTKYARLIEIAARDGGGDPSKNTKLRALIDDAKSESVPNVNIERAIKKGTGELKGEAMQEVTYEAYGPHGTAYIIETLTDNKNRTNANVRTLVTKHGGRMAEGGAVAWLFDRKGVLTAELQGSKFSNDIEALELELIDFGAEDVDHSEGIVRVVCGMAEWPRIRDFLNSNSCKVLSAGLSYLPKQHAPVDAAGMAQVHTFMDVIEEDDDVNEVHTNAVQQ
jgi:YebC/PmpR family DNA-binding regulatory protein